MQRDRLRIEKKIEDYKALEIAFRRNGNHAKWLEMKEKREQLENDLLFMTMKGIKPEPSKREKQWRQRQEIIKVMKAVAIMLIIGMGISLIMLAEQNRELKQEVKDLTVMVTAARTELTEPARGSISRMEPIGTFEIYHYCPCEKCCGKADRITATGTMAEEGRTIAVDPTVIPLGTKVIIEGQAYTAEDTGSGIKGNKIDMFVGSHEEALQLGVDTKEVYIERR